MDRIWGWSEKGGGTVITQGVQSANNTLVQRSFPGATVTVYIAGGNNLATIYSDNNSTPLANPFTANNNTGYWSFYAAAGHYDIQFSGNNAGIASPFTLPDVSTGSFQTINNQSGPAIILLTGSSGNNFNIAANNNNITLNLPLANNNNNGYLSAAAYAIFSAKQSALSFTAPLVNTNNTVALTTPLAIAYGGSNANTATQAFTNLSPITTKGDLIAGNANAVPVRLPVGANNLALLADGNNTSGIVWGQVPLTAGVTGVLPIANGGSNANTATQAFTNLSPLTTKGDLITANATNVPVRLPIGSNNQMLIADGSNTSGVRWGNANLADSGFTGVLPSSRGGTGGNNNAQGFDLLAPTTTNGDMILRVGGTNARLAIGANNTILTANNNNAVWQTPWYQVIKTSISYNNNAFAANSASVDIALFTLGQYQKVAGVTVKAGNLFLNTGNSITDVSVSVGTGSNAVLFSANHAVGNSGNIGNSNFQDTPTFKSANMGANDAVLARFVATGANFGNGANTVLISGNLDIWVAVATLQL